MKSEADVRGVLTRALRANNALVQPIESPLTGLGIPDLYVRTSKVSAWIELKYERYEPKFPYIVQFRPGQYGWLKRHWELGGTSVLGIWMPSGFCCFKNGQICQCYGVVTPLMSSINGATFIEWINDPID